MKKAIVFASLLVSFSYAHSVELHTIVTREKACMIFAPVSWPDNKSVSWYGDCPDNYISGSGQIRLNQHSDVCDAEAQDGYLKHYTCVINDVKYTTQFAHGEPVKSYADYQGKTTYYRIDENGNATSETISISEADAYVDSVYATYDNKNAQPPKTKTPSTLVTSSSKPGSIASGPSQAASQSSDADQSPQAIAEVISSAKNQCSRNYEIVSYSNLGRTVEVGDFLKSYNYFLSPTYTEDMLSKFTYEQWQAFKNSFTWLWLKPPVYPGEAETAASAAKAIDCFMAKFPNKKYAPKPVTPERVAKAESSGTPARFTTPPCIFFEQVSTDKISDMYKVIHNRCNRPMTVLYCFHDVRDVVHAKCNFDKDYAAWGITSVIPAGRDALVADTLGVSWGASYMTCENTAPEGCKFPKKEDHTIPAEGQRVK